MTYTVQILVTLPAVEAETVSMAAGVAARYLVAALDPYGRHESHILAGILTRIISVQERTRHDA